MKHTAITVVMLLVLVMGCSSPIGDVQPDLNGPGDLVKNVPELKVQLPASLSADTTSTSSSMQSRALGDVVEVQAAALPGLRSNGWGELQQRTGMDPTLEAFLEILKATIPSNYESGQIVDVGVLNVGDYLPEAGDYPMDFGKYVIGGTESEAVVHWYFTEPDWDDPALLIEYYCRLTVTNNNSFFEVDFLVSGLVGTEAMTYYAYFNANTGESIFASEFGTSDTTIGTSSPNPDGSVTAIMKSTYDGDSYEYVAWGDSEAGGVMGKDTWSGSTSVFAEFYGSNGDLIRESWGESALTNMWLPDVNSAFNLKTVLATKPTEVWLKWNGTAYEYSTNGTSYSPLTGYDRDSHWDLVWIENTATSAWAPGDVGYYWDRWEDTAGASVYTIGYTVPSPTSYLGIDVYLSHTYSLKRLMPIGGTYSEWSLLREEGETHSWDWTDWDGNTVTDSWTDYWYFLDNPSSGVVGTRDEQDVELNSVWMRDMWSYNTSTRRYESVKAPVVHVDGALPDYFTFSDEATISSVQTRIQDIYDNELPTLSIDDFSTRLVDLTGESVYGSLK